MASRAPFEPDTTKREQGPAGARRRGPSLPTIAALLVTLLILFLWTHFLLAHELETIGRDIQEKSRELERIERANSALERDIAANMSQAKMAERAIALGYGFQPPVYLPLSRPLGQPEGYDVQEGARPPVVPDGLESSSLQGQSFLNVVAHTFELASDTGAQP